MMKRIFIYLISAMLCAACETEEMTSTEVTTLGEDLALSVSVSDFESTDPVASTATRATDNGANTTFEAGDRVGVIILDANGKLLVDNAPYKYDGSKWALDADDWGQPIYVDPAMRKYIVYYPYDASVDGATSVEELKKLDVFRVSTDQSTEEAYRQADLMAWETDGAAMKQINAQLTHARASFALAPTIRWELPTGEYLDYVYAEDVIIYDHTDIPISPYKDADGIIHYILPEDYKGNFRWIISYLGKYYGGHRDNLSGAAANTRYLQKDIFDQGKYTDAPFAAGDFYCVRNVNGREVGYVLPRAVIPRVTYGCIGIVFKLGVGPGDDLDNYEGKLTENPIHGYAVALQDAQPRWGMWGKLDVDEELPNEETFTDKYNGYTLTQTIRELEEYKNNDISNYRSGYWAFKVASEYDVRTPENSSGWYLPSIGQLQDIFNLPDRAEILNAAGGKEFEVKESYGNYWSSTERSGKQAWTCEFIGYGVTTIDKNGTYSWPPGRVRSVLTF